MLEKAKDPSNISEAFSSKTVTSFGYKRHNSRIGQGSQQQTEQLPTESETQSEMGGSVIEGSAKKRKTPGSVKKFKPTQAPQSQYSDLFKFNMSEAFQKQPSKQAVSSSVGFKGGREQLAPINKRE